MSHLAITHSTEAQNMYVLVNRAQVELVQEKHTQCAYKQG